MNLDLTTAEHLRALLAADPSLRQTLDHLASGRPVPFSIPAGNSLSDAAAAFLAELHKLGLVEVRAGQAVYLPTPELAALAASL
jgi:hypothetical protein